MSGIPRGLLKRDAKKGICFFGVPGSGKTWALLNFILQLFTDGIPFIFFAPIKGEQTVIKKFVKRLDRFVRGLARNVRVFTPGRDDVAPLHFNPFKRLPHISLNQHVDGLMECFKGAIPFFPALEGVLREALYLIFRQYPDPDNPPVMHDLLRAAKQVVAEKGYQGETLDNVRAAIDTRLGTLCTGSMGSILNLGITSPTIEQLAQGFTIIELDALGEDQQALFILFILKALREYLSAAPPCKKYLRLAVIIDEAHRVVGADTKAVQSEECAKPNACASRGFCRMLAECRKRDVCMALADQTPSAVAADVVRMTGTKLAFRIVDEPDRRTVGGAMLFSDYEHEQIARLLPGEAFLYTEGYYRPRLIKTVDLTARMPGLDDLLTHQELHDLICNQPWYLEARRVSESAKLERLLKEMSRLDAQRLGIAKQALRLCADFTLTKMREGDVSCVVSEMTRARNRLEVLLRDFRFGPYEQLLGRDEPGDPEPIRAARADILRYFKGSILPDIENCVSMLEAMNSGA